MNFGAHGGENGVRLDRGVQDEVDLIPLAIEDGDVDGGLDVGVQAFGDIADDSNDLIARLGGSGFGFEAEADVLPDGVLFREILSG
jgi:hypothetical protein